MERSEDGQVVGLEWVEQRDLAQDREGLLYLVAPGVLARRGDVEESATARSEGVVTDHGGDLLVLRSDLVVQAGVVRRPLCWVVRVERHQLLDQRSRGLLPVDLLEVIDDVLVCRDVELVDQGEESALVDHVAHHEGDVCHLALCCQLCRVVNEILPVWTRVPRDKCGRIGQEVGLALDCSIDALIRSLLGTSKLVGCRATANSVHEAVEVLLGVVVIKNLWNLQTKSVSVVDDGH